MPTPSNLSPSTLREFIQTHYGLQPLEINYLPRGGDINAAVYRLTTLEGKAYFLKLLSGIFDETSVIVPGWLGDLGIHQVIAPVAALDKRLWAQIEDFSAILYPFVEGQNAFESPLTETQWVEFGAALRAVHSAAVPPGLRRRMQEETYSPQFRERVRRLLPNAQEDTFDDPVTAQYAEILTARSAEILAMADKADRLAARLQAQPPEFVLCHTDIHAGNLLIDAQGRLFIIDWDHPILAPKERDLMFIGGGVGSAWYQPQETTLFYQGYRDPPNPVALTYYRFERILQDLAEWGELVCLTREGVNQRERALFGLRRWFSPHDVVAMAYEAEKMVGENL